jgi:hypothetical protein
MAVTIALSTYHVLNSGFRHRLKKCGECCKQFTAKVRTVFEDAKLPLHLMLQAVHLMVCTKKRMSSYEFGRVLEIQYNSASFSSHFIREVMRSDDLAPFDPIGGFVEVDETLMAFAAVLSEQIPTQLWNVSGLAARTW